MQIWVDADACPVEIKELLYRTAERLKIKLTLVANQSMRVPRSEFIATLLVPDGANIADRRIVELASPGDLVVTADIPLAADTVAKGVAAIVLTTGVRKGSVASTCSSATGLIGSVSRAAERPLLRP